MFLSISGSNPTSLPPTLPQEITDQIIDHLHSSKPTLKTLTQINHSWLPRARYHLFRHISVDLRYKPCLGSYVAQFRVCVYGNPEVARYTRGLEMTLRNLKSVKGKGDVEGKVEEELQEGSLQDIPARMTFTNLRFLRINFACQRLMRDEPWRTERLCYILRSNPLLEHLTLETLKIGGESLRDIFTVLREHVKGLKVFVLNDVMEFVEEKAKLALEEGVVDSNKERGEQISLEGLVLSQARGTQGVMSAVFRSPWFNWNGLKRLALIGDLDEEGARVIVDSGCGESVTCLTLDVRALHSEEVRALIISNFPQVTHLQLISAPCENDLVILALQEIEKSMHMLEELCFSNAMLNPEIDECLVRLSSSSSLRGVSISFGNWFARPSLLDLEDVKRQLPRTTSETGVDVRSKALDVWWHKTSVHVYQ